MLAVFELLHFKIYILFTHGSWRWNHCTLHFEGTKPYVLCTKCSVILWDEFAPVVLTE